MPTPSRTRSGRVVYRGFVVHGASDEEVSNLLGLYQTLGTIAALITGSTMSALTAVNMDELASADAYGMAHGTAGYTLGEVGTKLLFSGLMGLLCSATSVITSTILYVSLSSLNIGTGHPASDAVLVKWLTHFGAFFIVALVSLWGAIMMMVITLYYIAWTKFTCIASDQYSAYIYGMGIIFMVGSSLAMCWAVKVHSWAVKDLNEEFDKHEMGDTGTGTGTGTEGLGDQAMKINRTGTLI